MNLSELHKRLAREPTYRKAYDAIGDVVLIGAAVRKLREQEEVTQAELVNELGVSPFYLSRLETGSGKVPPEIVATLVRRFEKQLRKLGINVEPWLAIKLPTPEPQQGTRAPDGTRRTIIPDGGSRFRHAGLRRKPEAVVREKPTHKYGKHD